MDIKEAAETLDAHPDFRVLRRLRISDTHIFAENVQGEPCGRLAVIDTETTGLKAELGDRIIDLAIATCEYPTHKVFQVSLKRNGVRRCPPPSEKLQPVSAVNLCSSGMCAARFGFDFNELAQPVSINPLSIIRLHALGQPEKPFGTLVLGQMSATVGGAVLQIALALFQQGGGTMAVPCKLGGIDRFEHERLQS